MTASAPLTAFGPGLWLADGPVLSTAGFRYPTRSAVIRLDDGGLFVWSPVALTDALHAAVTALGTPRHLVAPNHLHHSFLAEWQRAFPEATTWAPPGLRDKRPELSFGGDLGQPAPWQGEIDAVMVPGNRITTETVFFHRASATAIFTDLLQHFPPGWFTGWRRLVARADAMTGSEPQVPRKFRLAFRDRPAARAAIREVLDWPTERVLMAHGAPVYADGKALLARAFRWLTS